MSTYPDSIELKIGFDRIRLLVKEKCQSDLGCLYVDKTKFSNDKVVINRLVCQTEEFSQILKSQAEFPKSNFQDVQPLLKEIEIPGSYLIEEEMFELGLVLRTILSCLSFLNDHKDQYPTLFELANVITINASISEDILRIFELNGELKDSASPQLNKIRKALISAESKLRKTIERILKSSQQQGYSDPESQVSIREGRLVIPVHVESKRRIQGLIQDQSSSGQTVYIEPTEAVEVNNEISELRYEEKREIIRILTALSDLIRPDIAALIKANAFLGKIDFIRAKALFAIEIEGVQPEMASNQVHRLKDARHPLLQLHHQSQNKDVIPLSLELNANNRILIISGPNAGGKSVSLKTVGLIQYMWQCGLLIPADESSSLMVFDKLFIDIGDEQSIENDLSTYSSHLTNMKFFVEHTNERSLFLIDEFGTGTEPQFGGSIAEVILGQLNSQKAFGVVTTHYANLKKLAEKKEGLINGAMRYDVEKLKPLYRLEIGKPGSSFALEIAGKIGLNKKLIQRAKQLVGHSHVKFDQLVNQLESQKTELENQVSEMAKKQQWLENELKDYRDLKEHIEQERKDIIAKAKLEAERLLNRTNKEIELTIKGIKEAKAEKERTQQLRKSLNEFKKDHTPTRDLPKKKMVAEIPSVGDQVRIKGHETVGELLKLKGKQAEILMGTIVSRVKLDKLEKVGGKVQKSYDRAAKVKGMKFEQRAAQFQRDLDLRGNRASEAVGKLDGFLDEAILLGINEVRIIHGKGNGILRETIRNYLRDYDQIKSIKDEHIEQGGAGVSVISLV